MRIKKAVIPVAGMGTRFMPYTKAVPKEMLPIIDIPSIHFIIEEALNSGIKEVLFITAPGKGSIKDYFDKKPELEKFLKKKASPEILEQFNRIPTDFKKKFCNPENSKRAWRCNNARKRFYKRRKFRRVSSG